MKETNFRDIETLDFFKIKGELGSADFIKRSFSKALCLESQNGSYHKGLEYIILEDQIIIPDCYENL